MARSSEAIIHALILYVLVVAVVATVAPEGAPVPEGSPSRRGKHSAVGAAHDGTSSSKKRLVRREPRAKVSKLEKKEAAALHPSIGMMSQQEALHPIIGDLPPKSALHPKAGELPTQKTPHVGELPAQKLHQNGSTARKKHSSTRILTHNGTSGNFSADGMFSYSPYGSGPVVAKKVLDVDKKLQPLKQKHISSPMVGQIRQHFGRPSNESDEELVERASDVSAGGSKQSGVCPQPVTGLKKLSPTYTVSNAGTTDANGEYMLKLSEYGGPPMWEQDTDFKLFRDQGGVWHIMRAGKMLYDQPASAHFSEVPPQGQWTVTAGSTASSPGPCIVARKRRPVGPPQDYFLFNKAHPRNCEPGYKFIENEPACKYAAEFLGVGFVGTHHYELDHPGCRTYIYQGKRVFYFNTLQRLHPDVAESPEGVHPACQAENMVIQYQCSGASNLSATGLKENQADACFSACVSAAKGRSGCCQHATAMIDDSSLSSGSDWTCNYYVGGSIMLSEANQLGYYAAAVQPETVAPIAPSFELTLPSLQENNIPVGQRCVDDVEGYIEKMGETCGTFAGFCETYIEERKQKVKQMCPKVCGLCNGDDTDDAKPAQETNGKESKGNEDIDIKKFVVPGGIGGSPKPSPSSKGNEGTKKERPIDIKKFVVPGGIKENPKSASSKGNNAGTKTKLRKSASTKGGDDTSKKKNNDENEGGMALTVVTRTIDVGTRKIEVNDVGRFAVGAQITVFHGMKEETKKIVGISTALLESAVTPGEVEVDSPFTQMFPAGAVVQYTSPGDVARFAGGSPSGGPPVVVHHKPTVVHNRVVNNRIIHNHHHHVVRNKECPANCSNGDIPLRNKCTLESCQQCDICLLKESMTNNMQQQREEMSEMILDSISKVQSKILREAEESIMSKIDDKIDKIVQSSEQVVVTPGPSQATPAPIVSTPAPPAVLRAAPSNLLKTNDLIKAWISDGRVTPSAMSLYYDVEKFGRIYSRFLNGKTTDSIPHCPTSPEHVSTGCCVGDEACADRLFMVKFKQEAVKHAIIRVYGNDLLQTACTVFTSVDGKHWILYDRLEGEAQANFGYREIVVSTDMRYFGVQFSHLDVRLSEFESYSVQPSGQKCTKMVCPQSHALSEGSATKFCERDTCEVSTDLAKCCSKRASCKHLTCSIGKRLVQNAEEVLCEKQVCTSDDVETCCAKAPNCTQLDEGLCGSGRYLRADASDIECDSHNCTAQDSVLCCTEPADCDNFPTCGKLKEGWKNKKQGWKYKCSGPVCDKDRDFDTCCMDTAADVRSHLIKMVVLFGGIILCCVVVWKRQQSEIQAFMREKEIRDLMRQKRKNKQQEQIKAEERRVDSKDGEVLTFQQFLTKYNEKYSREAILELWSQLKLEETYAATRLQAAFRGEQVRKETQHIKLRRKDPEDGKSYSFTEMFERKKAKMSHDEFVAYWKTLEEDLSELEGKRQDVDGNFYTYDEIYDRYKGIHNSTQILSWWRVLKQGEVNKKIGYVGTPQLLKNERMIKNLRGLVTALISRGHEITVGEPNKELADGTKALVTDMAAAPANKFDIVLVAPGGPGAQAEAEKFATSATIYYFVNLEDEKFGQPEWLLKLAGSTEKFDLPSMKADQVATKIQEHIVSTAAAALAAAAESKKSVVFA